MLSTCSKNDYNQIEDMTPTGITVSSYLENETDLSEFNKAWITMENLRTPEFTFISYLNTKHYAIIEDNINTIEAFNFNSNPNLIFGDIQATDGIIHKIDKMLCAINIFDFSK